MRSNKPNKLSNLIYGKYRAAIELAYAMNWRKSKLTKICSGQRRPSLDDVFDLAKALDTQWEIIGALFYDTGTTR